MKRLLKNIWRSSGSLILCWVLGLIIAHTLIPYFFKPKQPEWHTHAMMFDGAKSKYSYDTNFWHGVKYSTNLAVFDGKLNRWLTRQEVKEYQDHERRMERKELLTKELRELQRKADR